ncbi:hypothetical protein BaRGS_00034908 [Batillaria attramentaria]|uniref:Uncharacterized protein n=1 Tax=Batillaria attramentaria TaxID=370345 RepID=A0ABD0JG11_9CAEN
MLVSAVQPIPVENQDKQVKQRVTETHNGAASTVCKTRSNVTTIIAAVYLQQLASERTPPITTLRKEKSK